MSNILYFKSTDDATKAACKDQMSVLLTLAHLLNRENFELIMSDKGKVSLKKWRLKFLEQGYGQLFFEDSVYAKTE